MQLKGLFLVPSHFGNKGVKLNTHQFSAQLPDGNVLSLDLLEINSKSLSSMPEDVSNYYNNVIKRFPSEGNASTTAYFGIVDLLFHRHPNGLPIKQEILDIIHQDRDFQHIQENSGYYFQLDMDEWRQLQKIITKLVM